MAMESAIFSQKSPHKFSNTDPSNLIISRLTHLQTFSLKTKKQPILQHKRLFTVLQISTNLGSTTLNATVRIFERGILYLELGGRCSNLVLTSKHKFDELLSLDAFRISMFAE